MSDRSFEKFDYALRPNKNVERKMLFRSLRELEAYFGLSAYRYVGLGSLWFVDFQLAHRELGISDMITMEREKSRAKRVEFNRPLRCIQVHMDKASEALPKVLGEKKSVVWLDYDGGLDSALGGDLEIALGRLAAGSFIAVTVNAEVAQLEKRDQDNNPIAPAKVLAELSDDESWLERQNDVNRKSFPGIVAGILLERMRGHILTYRPALEFFPIWNFRYADGAIMVTVGGMIGDQSDKVRLDRANLFSTFPYVTGETPYPIQLPVLTTREKREFDRRLPATAAVSASDLPFELKDAEISAYQRHYAFYPVYDELAT